jgi:hypothetical protein
MLLTFDVLLKGVSKKAALDLERKMETEPVNNFV